VAALTLGIGKAAELHAALSVLRGDLEWLQVIVQHAANAHPTDGPAVITTSGMSAKDNRGPGRADFAVRLGRVPGTVVLIARSIGRKAPYEWNYSLDGKHWTSVEPTHDAETTLSGLAAPARHSFRFRARSAGGLGAWSRVITVLVVGPHDGAPEPAKPGPDPRERWMAPERLGQARCERSMRREPLAQRRRAFVEAPCEGLMSREPLAEEPCPYVGTLCARSM